MDGDIQPVTRDDAALWWVAIVYTGCFYMLGLGAAKSIIIFPVVLISAYVNLGRRWILRAGFGLLVVTVLVWINALPDPDKWVGLLTTATQVAADIRAHAHY
jgi:hypothetical protein